MQYARTRRYFNAVIPTSTRVSALTCGDPNCKSIHLIGFDEENEPLFEIVVSKDVYNKMGVIFEGMK